MRKILEMGKIPFGDFRDWNAIAAWAKGLPSVLKVQWRYAAPTIKPSQVQG
jgi:hypothetical protein